MPDKKLEDMLGAEEETEQAPAMNPLEATPDGEGEGNPLEKMDEISKAKPDKKKQGSKDLDEDTVAEMLMTGENTEGMFSPDEKKGKDAEELHEDVDDKAKIKVGSKVEPKGKYEKMFKNDMLKNPTEYKISTPKGEMTVAEAIQAGYNPLTKQFEKEHSKDAIKEKHLSQLNDTDRASVEKLLSPESAQVAPADAEKYGLKQDSPLVRQQQQEEQQAMNPMATMAGGMPQAAAPMPASPEGMPAGPEQAGAQPDLAAMLGGGM